MAITDAMLLDFDDIEDFTAALVSPTMYLHPNLYNHFCLGMESGKLRGMEVRTQTCALQDMLSIAYEAHFRLELYLACGTQGYRHSYSADALKARAAQFSNTCRAVKSDREENGIAAWHCRQTHLRASGDFHATELTEDALQHGGVQFDDDAF